ncbi:uroporphyrinogen decarboxylase [Riemerella anatipestifer]|uniref:uroporphyrinogen decarboxylase n=1 Tax=Riemerella anatipestifer TaxID=34085 RepID=UPI0039058A73
MTLWHIFLNFAKKDKTMNPEYIGYLASAFVAISFLLKEINKIRMVNLIGCLLFVAYGFLIDSLPVTITNILISLVQIYYLFLAKKQ